MGLIEPAYRDRVRYTLRHDDYGSLVIPEPEGWQSDEKEIVRHKEYHGMFAKFSNSLKFHLDAADYITLVKKLYGINASIQLIKEERHPDTDVWERSYDGFLDLSTYENTERVISVKFNASGLEQTLKARESEKVEIDREVSIDGKDIGELYPDNVELRGRRILLRTSYGIDPANNSTSMYNRTNGQTRGRTIGIPLNITGQSHVNAHSVIPNTSIADDTTERNANGTTGFMFFSSSDRTRELRIKFNISFTIRITNYDDINKAFFWFRLATYENGVDYNFKDNRVIFRTFGDHGILNYNNQTLNFSFDESIEVLVGESLSLQFSQLMDGENRHRARLNIHCLNIQCDLSIEEDSFFEKTPSKFILASCLKAKLFFSLSKTSLVFSTSVCNSKRLKLIAYFVRCFSCSSEACSCAFLCWVFKSFNTLKSSFVVFCVAVSLSTGVISTILTCLT